MSSRLGMGSPEWVVRRGATRPLRCHGDRPPEVPSMARDERARRELDLSAGLAFGTQYYRAPTPRPEDWERDLTAIRDHGFNTVKYFCQWRWSHPGPGEFYFDDLDRLMDLAAERELQVIINTLFDIIPAWVTHRHPDCMMRRQDGRRLGPTGMGHRQIGGVPGPCLNHPTARQLREEFLRETVRRYADHPAMWVWDVWNEPELTVGLVRQGPARDQICWCSSCRQAFAEWLKAKYSDLGDLNEAWARNYRGWEEVELPGEVYCVSADWTDWRLFFRDTVTGEQRWRSEVAREEDAGHPVMCHTVPPPIFSVFCCGADDFELAEPCDLFGCTTSCQIPMMADFARSAGRGRPMLASEIHALPGSTLNRPSPLSTTELERQILMPLFQGYKGFVFWQYRAELLGSEGPAWGLTRPDGSPEPWLEDCRDLAKLLTEHTDFLREGRSEPAPVAILSVPENEIFFYSHDGSHDRYWAGLRGAYRLLRSLGRPVDFIHPSNLGEASQYAAIVAPIPYAYPSSVAEDLKAYVRGGGRLLTEGFLCALDPASGMTSTVHPGMGMDELVGCREVSVTPSGRVDMRMSYGSGGVEPSDQPRMLLTEDIGGLGRDAALPGRLAEQRLEVTTGRVLARFVDGSAAIVENDQGSGSTVHIGTWIFQAYSETGMEELASLVDGLLGLPSGWASSPDVRVDRIETEDRAWLLLTNETEVDSNARVRVEGGFERAVHLRKDETLAEDGQTVTVHVPAGGHVIVDVIKAG
ncbi:MAG: cellulase family glycosylhydrolase [Armatimonadia bacterium]|nr:cellulase family glycosylhydrolase [Armatimonadia bacterium]